MARKDLMKGLMDAPSPTPPAEAETARVDAAKPRYQKGAIGAVSQQIADLKARSVQELDPRLIDDAGMRDRLGADEDHAALTASIQEYGQQVPVLVRPNPNDPERYQVVYGRRRVAALKALGLPVKAMVRILDDRDLILAQGQENAARKDLSFIEKANFARQMRDAGYDRKVICDALHMDKTLISRLLSVADRVPLDLIEAIGAAPNVGRERWLALADALNGRDMVEAARGESSDTRFDAVAKALTPDKPAPPAPHAVMTAEGKALAQAKRAGGKTVLTLDKTQDDGFHDWLIANLARLHGEWKTTR
ncbi:plasmid partitioning protein RepB [Pseudaestuariivita sp.]|uniref:plasmid partitioning protein RepB n=1 Tax=Pseudaestuariivita sp. TaxID=2211669 RepID=UPI00405901E5